ncbi:hypothetical protein E1286_11685 [Nonomuraea terrae]|uniref:Tissue inhibitor of metalloproteinase n=1 Tax=Nonomuraea terrae TaxID=2530383 RepID=A0A4R4Z461_9ACTN|nr:hypothetical protein [Nonomuraea terrae]TDD50852.1 hypothetical protein E1286_11685 [Nonomuraea terrae]
MDEPMLNGGSLTARLRTDHVYKGERKAEFEVFTKAQGAACGYEFVKGARYLVFAGAQSSGLSTTLCSGNRLLPAGDRPLRLSDRTQGVEPLTRELIAALGTPARAPGLPARANHEPAPISDWAGPTVIATVMGAIVLSGIAWTRKLSQPGHGQSAPETRPTR